MLCEHFHFYSIQKFGNGIQDYACLNPTLLFNHYSNSTSSLYLYKIERVILHLSIHKSDFHHVYSILVNDPYIFAIDPIDDIHNSPDIVLHYRISILEQELKLGHALGTEVMLPRVI